MKKVFKVVFISLAVLFCISPSNHALGNIAKAQGIGQEPQIVKELVDRRTANTKVYQLSSGKLQYDVYSTDVHYLDKQNKYQDIDLSAVDVTGDKRNDGYVYKNGNNNWDVYFGKDGKVNLVNNKYQITFFPNGDDKNITAKRASDFSNADKQKLKKYQDDKSVVLYEKLKKDSDYVYQIKQHGVKESIVLSAIPDSNTFSYTFSLVGLIPIKENGTYSFCDAESKKSIFEFDPFFAEDANGNQCYNITVDIESASENNYTMTLVVDDAYLKADTTVYPVIIDPSLSISGSSKTFDSYISSAHTTTSYAGNAYLRTGNDGPSSYGTRRAYIAFQLPASLNLSDIWVDSAQLKLKLYSSAGTLHTRAASPSDGWSSTGNSYYPAITWNNAPPATGTQYAATVSSGWHSMDVTNIVFGWVYYHNDNNGFVVSDSTENNANIWATFYSSDCGTASYCPVLSITVEDVGTAYSVYGGNLDPTDVTVFADNITMAGYTCTKNIQNCTPSTLVNANNVDILYWSSHGISSPTQISYNNPTNGLTYMNVQNVLHASSSSFNSTVSWNNRLSWVILAACHQMEASNRTTWARTMLGYDHPVRIICGYSGTGPDDPDDIDVLNMYFAYPSPTGMVYNWIDANIFTDDNLQPGVLYHENALEDMLPGLTYDPGFMWIDTDTAPQIYCMSYDYSHPRVLSSSSDLPQLFNYNSRLISSAQSTLSAFSKFVHLASNWNFTAGNVDISTNPGESTYLLDLGGNTVKQMKSSGQYKASYPTVVASPNNYSSVAGNAVKDSFVSDKSSKDVVYTKGEAKFKIKDNGYANYINATPDANSVFAPDLNVCRVQASNFASKYLGLPGDSRLARSWDLKVGKVDLTGTQSGNERVIAHTFKYEHMVNDLPVSSMNGGNAIYVVVGNAGVNKALMKWNNLISKTNENKIISEDDAMRFVLKPLQGDSKYAEAYGASAVVTANSRLVYSNAFSGDNSQYIPAWEVRINGDRTILVNAVSGEFKDLCD